jgi:hypothetical protein
MTSPLSFQDLSLTCPRRTQSLRTVILSLHLHFSDSTLNRQHSLSCTPYAFYHSHTIHNLTRHINSAPIAVAARSQACVCLRSLAGSVGSSSARDKDVFLVCFVLSGRGLCVGPITRPEECYRLCVCVCVCVCE